MSKNDVFKSKEFKDKESKLRENLRLSNAQELIGDFLRLLEEKLFCDVTFTVEDVEFPAHVSILQARAPKFSKQFLPSLSSPSVQSCINIHNLQADKFVGFLRSVYAENVVQDYSEVDYPWAERVLSKTQLDELQSPLVKNLQNEFDDSLDGCEDVQDDQSKSDTVMNGKGNDFTKQSSIDACCKIGQDLINLVNDSKSSDVTFTLNDNEKVKAHRAILCARSNYFSAMLFGDWSEREAHEIPLLGISHQAFLVVLYFLYGGITSIPLDSANDICDVLYLADMYGLEGLKEVVLCELKLIKCHLFHKWPCPDCLAGVLECLEVSEVFHLDDLKKQCLKWVVRYFDRVYSTKSFGYLSPKLQESIQCALQSSINRLNVIDLLCRGDKVASSLPPINWSKPVLDLVSMHVNACLSFIAENFSVMVSEQPFRDMLKGVGWSTPLLEKIFMAVWNSLSIQNCCERFKVTMRLRNEMALRSEHEEDILSEEADNLTEKLRTRCQNFIVSNLHRVSHTDGWKHLSPRTQTEIRKSEGGMFVDVGLPSQRNRTFPAPSKSLSNSLRSNSSKRPPSQVGPPRNQKARAKSAGIPTCAQDAKSRKPGTVTHKRPVSASSTSLRQTRSTASTSFSKPPTGSGNRFSAPRAGSSKTSIGNKNTMKEGDGDKSGIATSVASSKTKESCSKSMLVVGNATHSRANTTRKSMSSGATNTSMSSTSMSSSSSTRGNTKRNSVPPGVSNTSSKVNTTTTSMASSSSTRGNTKRKSMASGACNISSTLVNTTRKSMPGGASNTSSTQVNTTRKLPAGAHSSSNRENQKRKSMPVGARNTSSTPVVNTTRKLPGAHSSSNRENGTRKSMSGGACNISSTENTTRKSMSAGARNTSSTLVNGKLPGAQSSSTKENTTRKSMSAGARNTSSTRVNGKLPGAHSSSTKENTTRQSMPAGASNISSKTNIAKSTRQSVGAHSGSSSAKKSLPGKNVSSANRTLETTNEKHDRQSTASSVKSCWNQSNKGRSSSFDANRSQLPNVSKSSRVGRDVGSSKLQQRKSEEKEGSTRVVHKAKDTCKNETKKKKDVETRMETKSAVLQDQVPPVEVALQRNGAKVALSLDNSLADQVKISNEVDNENKNSEEHSSNMALLESDANSPIGPSSVQLDDFKDKVTLETEMVEVPSPENQDLDTSSSSNTAADIINTTWTIESEDCKGLVNNIPKENVESHYVSQEHDNSSQNTAIEDANITSTLITNPSENCNETANDITDKNAGKEHDLSSNMAASLTCLTRTKGDDDGLTRTKGDDDGLTRTKGDDDGLTRTKGDDDGLTRTKEGDDGHDDVTVICLESDPPTTELSPRSNDKRQDISKDCILGKPLVAISSQNDKSGAETSYSAPEYEKEDTVSAASEQSPKDDHLVQVGTNEPEDLKSGTTQTFLPDGESCH